MTTKIYIKDFDTASLRKKLGKLDEYFRNQETSVELVSPEGLFTIENNKLYKLKPVDKEIVEREFEGFTLLFDNSYFEKEFIFSHVPYYHINLDVVKFYYGEENLGKKSFLRLVVEGLHENEDKFKIGEESIKDKYSDFLPTNFYFLANESFDNVLVKKELNVFLSMLK
jgi:hypothetical protein